MTDVSSSVPVTPFTVARELTDERMGVVRV